MPSTEPSPRRFTQGGVWGHAIGFNGDRLYSEEMVKGRWPFKRKISRHYRLVYSFGQYPKAGDLIDTRLGLHRVIDGRRTSDPDDMWNGRAEPIEPPREVSDADL